MSIEKVKEDIDKNIEEKLVAELLKKVRKQKEHMSKIFQDAYLEDVGVKENDLEG